MAMITGKLRHRVTIQTATIVTDPTYGGSYETWLPIADKTDPAFNQADYDAATIWAQVTPARGREFWDIKKSNSEVEGMVTMRYRVISPAQRLWFKGRVLEILFPKDREERNEMLEVYYREAQV